MNLCLMTARVSLFCQQKKLACVFKEALLLMIHEYNNFLIKELHKNVISTYRNTKKKDQ